MNVKIISKLGLVCATLVFSGCASQEPEMKAEDSSMDKHQKYSRCGHKANHHVASHDHMKK